MLSRGRVVVESVRVTEIPEAGEGEWPLEPFCDDMCHDLFDSRWEVRHGAAMAVRDALKHHAAYAGRCVVYACLFFSDLRSAAKGTALAAKDEFEAFCDRQLNMGVVYAFCGCCDCVTDCLCRSNRLTDMRSMHHAVCAGPFLRMFFLVM